MDHNQNNQAAHHPTTVHHDYNGNQVAARDYGNSPSAARTAAQRKHKKKNKQIIYNTMKLDIDPSAEVKEMLKMLKENERFTAASLEEQSSNLRKIGVPLWKKMKILKDLRENEGKQKNLSRFQSIKLHTALFFSRAGSTFRDIQFSTDLLAYHLKVIAGKFGSGVTSYFLFIKWLLLMNIPVFLLQFLLVVLPQILYRWHQQVPSGYSDDVPFSAKIILTGNGWMSNTELYYGYYYKGDIQLDGMGTKYSMSHAYICTVAAYFFITLMIVSYSLTQSYKKNHIETKGDKLQCATRVLCGWDYAITEKSGAKMKQGGIYRQLKELMGHLSLKNKIIKSDKKRLVKRVGILIGLNLLVVAIISASGYLVWFMSEYRALQNEDASWNDMVIPVTISAINYFLPLGFAILVAFEQYDDPRFELYLTMARSVALNVVTMGTLIIFLYNEVDCRNKTVLEDCKPCWENFMGEQLYRLVVVDFIFVSIIMFVAEIGLAFIFKIILKRGLPQFNIGRNTLYLIYSQALIWLGTFYSPLLPAIMILKLAMVFFIKRYSVSYICSPPQKAWRGEKAHTWIIFLLFIVFFLCFLVTGYGVVFIQPSEICGPYRGYNSSFDVITNMFDEWEDEHLWIKEIIEFATSPAFIYSVFIGFCVTIHYVRKVSQGWNTTIQEFRDQIAEKGKANHFVKTAKEEIEQTAIAAGQIIHAASPARYISRNPNPRPPPSSQQYTQTQPEMCSREIGQAPGCQVTVGEDKEQRKERKRKQKAEGRRIKEALKIEANEELQRKEHEREQRKRAAQLAKQEKIDAVKREKEEQQRKKQEKADQRIKDKEEFNRQKREAEEQKKREREALIQRKPERNHPANADFLTMQTMTYEEPSANDAINAADTSTQRLPVLSPVDTHLNMQDAHRTNEATAGHNRQDIVQEHTRAPQRQGNVHAIQPAVLSPTNLHPAQVRSGERTQAYVRQQAQGSNPYGHADPSALYGRTTPNQQVSSRSGMQGYSSRYHYYNNPSHPTVGYPSASTDYLNRAYPQTIPGHYAYDQQYDNRYDARYNQQYDSGYDQGYNYRF